MSISDGMAMMGWPWFYWLSHVIAILLLLFYITTNIYIYTLYIYTLYNIRIIYIYIIHNLYVYVHTLLHITPVLIKPCTQASGEGSHNNLSPPDIGVPL